MKGLTNWKNRSVHVNNPTIDAKHMSNNYQVTLKLAGTCNRWIKE